MSEKSKKSFSDTKIGQTFNKLKESKFGQFIRKYPEVVVGPLMLLWVFILIVIATNGLGTIDSSKEGTAFSIGSFSIKWYAIFILTGIIFAAIYGYYEFPRIGISRNTLTDGLLFIVPLSILGSRLYYVIFDPVGGYNSLWDVLDFTRGGLAIHGAIITAVILVIIFAKIKKKSIWNFFDILVIGFLIGQIIGRWGNFINQEAHGPEVVNSWVFRSLVPGFVKKNMEIGGVTYHPTFLYEGFLNFIVLVFLVTIRRFRALKVADGLGIYLVLYGVIRGLIIEPLRTDPLIIGGLKVNIVFSLALFGGGGLLFLILKYIFVKDLPFYYDLAINENLYTKGQEGREFRKRKKEELKKIRDKRNSEDDPTLLVSEEQVAQHATKSAVEEATKRKTLIKMIKGVLLDLDGTVIDSAPAILRCFDETFDKIFPGVHVTEEEKSEFLGPTLVHTFSQYTSNQGLVDRAVSAYVECSIKEHDEERIEAFPHAYQVLEELRKRGIKVGIVTSKRSKMAKYGLEINNLFQFVDIIVGSDHVENHKPNPEPLIKALEMLDLKPNEVIYVGDHENDILAAKAANITSVGVSYSYRLEQIKKTNPDHIITDLIEILNII